MGAKHTPHWALDVFEQNAQTMRIGGNGAVLSHMTYTHEIAAT